MSSTTQQPSAAGNRIGLTDREANEWLVALSRGGMTADEARSEFLAAQAALRAIVQRKVAA